MKKEITKYYDSYKTNTTLEIGYKSSLLCITVLMFPIAYIDQNVP